jgi:hypothetical protein
MVASLVYPEITQACIAATADGTSPAKRAPMTATTIYARTMITRTDWPAIPHTRLACSSCTTAPASTSTRAQYRARQITYGAAFIDQFRRAAGVIDSRSCAGSAGALAILDAIRKCCSWIKHLFADGAYDHRRFMDKAAFTSQTEVIWRAGSRPSRSWSNTPI